MSGLEEVVVVKGGDVGETTEEKLVVAAVVGYGDSGDEA